MTYDLHSPDDRNFGQKLVDTVQKVRIIRQLRRGKRPEPVGYKLLKSLKGNLKMQLLFSADPRVVAMVVLGLVMALAVVKRPDVNLMLPGFLRFRSRPKK